MALVLLSGGERTQLRQHGSSWTCWTPRLLPERWPGASDLPQLVSHARHACACTARWSFAWLLKRLQAFQPVRALAEGWVMIAGRRSDHTLPGDQHPLRAGCQPCGHHNLSGPDLQDLQPGGWCATAFLGCRGFL